MKIDRLLAITMLLLNRRRVSAKELADQFEVSLRTVYRDLETINQAGIPLVSYAGSAGGYEIMEQYRIDRQFLSLEELQSIIVALKGVHASLAEQEIGVLLDKVGALVARSEQGEAAALGQQLILDLNPWHGGEAEKEMLGTVRQAIRDKRLVEFLYTSSQGEDTNRVCEPMGVVIKGYVWYLYGYCRLRESVRVFRLSRIEHLKVLPGTFEPRPVALERLTCQWGNREPRDTVTLKLLFQPRAKVRVQDAFERSAIRSQPDGTLLVTHTMPDEPWLYGMLLGYGTDVRVLEPDYVADKLVEKAQEIVRQYTRILT